MSAKGGVKVGVKVGKRTNDKVNIVVDEIQSILQLAKKGRKKLKPDEIERCRTIDAKKLWGLIRDWTEGCKIPIDVLRIIFRYMEPKDYLRCGSRLCKKMNRYVKEDLIVIEADIHFSVSKYKKNGGSSSTSSFYTLRNVIFSKDLLNKNLKLIFKHKYGSIEELKCKYYQRDFDYNSNKRMY